MSKDNKTIITAAGVTITALTDAAADLAELLALGD
jgi:hypothetical protein